MLDEISTSAMETLAIGVLQWGARFMVELIASDRQTTNRLVINETRLG